MRSCAPGRSGFVVIEWKGVGMKTLVETVLSIESEADRRLAEARAKAQEIEERAQAELEAYRRELAEETERRIEMFREQAEEGFRKTAVQVQAEHEAALRAVDGVPREVMESCAERIAARFRDW